VFALVWNWLMRAPSAPVGGGFAGIGSPG
jgi:hypothetical protein